MTNEEALRAAFLQAERVWAPFKREGCCPVCGGWFPDSGAYTDHQIGRDGEVCLWPAVAKILRSEGPRPA